MQRLKVEAEEMERTSEARLKNPQVKEKNGDGNYVTATVKIHLIINDEGRVVFGKEATSNFVHPFMMVNLVKLTAPYITTVCYAALIECTNLVEAILPTVVSLDDQ